jgi:hypothetical protein
MARASPAASPTTTRSDLDRRPPSVDPKVGRDLCDRIRFDQIAERRVNPYRVKPAAPTDLGHGEPLDPKGAHDLAHGGPDQDRHALSMPPAAARSRAPGCYATMAEPSSTLRSLDPVITGDGAHEPARAVLVGGHCTSSSPSALRIPGRWLRICGSDAERGQDPALRPGRRSPCCSVTSTVRPMTMACRIPSRRAAAASSSRSAGSRSPPSATAATPHRALDNALRDLRRGARWRRGRALEVQPLVQMVRPANYGVFKGRWQRAWRDTEYSTARLAEEAAR